MSEEIKKSVWVGAVLLFRVAARFLSPSTIFLPPCRFCPFCPWGSTLTNHSHSFSIAPSTHDDSHASRVCTCMRSCGACCCAAVHACAYQQKTGLFVCVCFAAASPANASFMRAAAMRAYFPHKMHTNMAKNEWVLPAGQSKLLSFFFRAAKLSKI